MAGWLHSRNKTQATPDFLFWIELFIIYPGSLVNYVAYRKNKETD